MSGGADPSAPAGPSERQRLADAQTYQVMLDQVTDQLRHQLQASRTPGPTALVLVPAVGFGEQSCRVIERTVRLISAQRGPAVAITAVVLVNRPRARPADSTEAVVRRTAREAVARSCPTLAVASLEVPHSPRIGELRQLLLDATTRLLGTCPRSTTLVVADDDIVAAPANFVHNLSAYLARRPDIDLVLGPVLFDDDRCPSALLPEFFVGDLLRALLATRFTESLIGLNRSDTAPREQLWRQEHSYFESVVLSGHLGVRVSALQQAGGFRDLNEITGLMRDVHGLALAKPEPRGAESPGRTNIGSLWSFDAAGGKVIEDLLAVAVRMSSRRALHAFARGRHPSVAQWRACRFRASRIDPVRVHQPPLFAVTPLRALRPEEVRATGRGIERAIEGTLAYFPPDPEIVGDCLRAIGLGPECCVAEVAKGEAPRWSVRLRDPRALLASLQAEQDRVLERAGRPPRAPVLLPLETEPASRVPRGDLIKV